MADESKKKKVTADTVTESLSAVDSLNAAMVVQGAYIPDKTAVQFEYVFESEGDDSKVYTYTALWIADRSRWYISGVTAGVIGREMENTAFAKVLSTKNTISAMTLVPGESFK